MKTHWRDWLKTVGVFALIGPPVGWASMCVAAIIAGVFTGDTRAGDAGLLFIAIFAGSLWSYLMGGVPALVTGMIVGAFKHQLTSFLSWCLSACVGFLITSVFFVWFSTKSGDEINLDILISPFSFMGAAAAFVCAWISRPKTKKEITPPPPLEDSHEIGH